MGEFQYEDISNSTSFKPCPLPIVSSVWLIFTYLIPIDSCEKIFASSWYRFFKSCPWLEMEPVFYKCVFSVLFCTEIHSIINRWDVVDHIPRDLCYTYLQFSITPARNQCNKLCKVLAYYYTIMVWMRMVWVGGGVQGKLWGRIGMRIKIHYYKFKYSVTLYWLNYVTVG